MSGNILEVLGRETRTFVYEITLAFYRAPLVAHLVLGIYGF